ncbi:MAG: alanine--glyoxylate aminotransferase family protein [Spirochaetota bacterium]
MKLERTHKIFNPPVRTLMGPGPSDIHPRVSAALAKPVIGHLDPEFSNLMEDIKDLLRYAFQTKNDVTFPVSAPGSMGMEICFANLVEPGDKVIICRNGVFGNRMEENVKRMRGEAVMVDDEWGRAVDPQKLEEALKANPDAKIVAFVHAETSTGASSDGKTLAALAKQYGCLTIVDTVTSLGGSELRVDEWGLSAVYSGSQKCLSAPPGISPVTFSADAIEKIKNRKTPVQSWFGDINLVLSYWTGSGKRSYHHTAPVNAMYSLHEALLMLAEEGIEKAWQRHKDHHLQLKQGLENLGMQFIVPEAERLSQLNAVTIPEDKNEMKIRSGLLQKYNLEIGAGLGPLAGKIWRIGLMGHSCNQKNVTLCTEALADLLQNA